MKSQIEQNQKYHSAQNKALEIASFKIKQDQKYKLEKANLEKIKEEQIKQLEKYNVPQKYMADLIRFKI